MNQLVRITGCWVLGGLGGWAQGTKGAQDKPPAPADMLWHYDAPRGFQLPEPAYRFPTQIKQALVQYVQPVPALTQAYASVCTDKHRFAQWLTGVLLERKTGFVAAVEQGPTVLSSDPSRRSPGKGTVMTTRTSKLRTGVVVELEAIEGYLLVLKLWDPQ